MVVGVRHPPVPVHQILAVTPGQRRVQQLAQRPVPVPEHRHRPTMHRLGGQLERRRHRGVSLCSAWPTRTSRSATSSAATASSSTVATSKHSPTSLQPDGCATSTATPSPPGPTRSARCGSAKPSDTTAARARVTSRPTRSSTSTTPTAPQRRGRRTSSSKAPRPLPCSRSPVAATSTRSPEATTATGTGWSAATPSTTPATCRTISAAAESADLAAAARPVLRAQRLLVRLAERRQRNGVDKVDRLRRVDSALLRLDQLDQLVRLDGCVGAAYDDGLDRLAPLVVRHSDDADLRDAGVRADDVLHLAGEHVEAARHDHVLLAIDDRQEAGG